MDKITYLYCCAFNYFATGEGYDYLATFLIGESEDDVFDKFYSLYCDKLGKRKPNKEWFRIGCSFLPIKKHKFNEETYKSDHEMLAGSKEVLNNSSLKYHLSKSEINRLYKLIKKGGMVSGDFVFKLYYNLS